MAVQHLNETDPSAGCTPDRYLRLPEVLLLIGVSWRTVLRWEREGRFPKRYKIGARIVAWKESEIKRWFADGSVPATSTVEAT